MKRHNRKIQYYNDGGIWSYFSKGEMNPCGCENNCFHHEYDGEKMYCVRNACNEDIMR